MTSLAKRIAALQAEAKSEARSACDDFALLLMSVSVAAHEIVGMGDAVPVGIRELASRLVAPMEGNAQHVRKLNQ